MRFSYLREFLFSFQFFSFSFHPSFFFSLDPLFKESSLYFLLNQSIDPIRKNPYIFFLFQIITARIRSMGKVMLSEVLICSQGGSVFSQCHRKADPLQADPPPGNPPPSSRQIPLLQANLPLQAEPSHPGPLQTRYSQPAAGTHPTGMRASLI